jgi:hypothetical protein
VETTNSRLRAQPTLNQRFAATEREQTGLNVTLFVNVFGVFLRSLAAHNGLVAGSSPAGQLMKLIAYRLFLRTTAPETARKSRECFFSAHEDLYREPRGRLRIRAARPSIIGKSLSVVLNDPLDELGSSSNIRRLPTTADPVATRWRFLKSKKPLRRAAFQYNADLSASCLVAGARFELATFRL